MSVHYKFKSALDFDTITFDGLHISVADLKKAITHQKRLGKAIDFDLQITNAQSKEVYSDNNALIPKNTSLIIARVPLIHQPKKSWELQAEKSQVNKSSTKADSDTLDLSLMNGSEEDKINAMMMQSTADYDPKGYQKLRGQSQTGDVPANYRCFKCHKPGHWIKNCPLNLNKENFDVKRNTGIPRSFRQDKDSKEAQEKLAEEPKPLPLEKQEIPDELICNICKDLFTDAVMIPCCGSSFCDDCVRTALLESEDNECPDCKEKGSSPGSLIPNRFLRNSVNAFKNETGYNRTPQKKSIVIAESAMETVLDSKEEHMSPNGTDDSAKDGEESNPTEENLDVISKENSPEHTENSKGTIQDSYAHSSHDESDFEDNITVTVPPAYMQSHGPHPRERTYNGNNTRRLRSTGIDNSPRPNFRRSSPNNEHQSRNPHRENREPQESINENIDHEQKHHMQFYHQRDENIRPPHRPLMYMQPGPMMPNLPQNMHGHIGPPMQKPQFMEMCAPHPGYHPPFNRPPQFMGPGPGPNPGLRPPFIPMGPMRPRLVAPPNMLAAVYKNVAEKVGTGIIDDPLEAFNRLMKERENRQELRRRSPERQRSRSVDRNFRGQMRPGPNRRQWHKSPERGRSSLGRSKERSSERNRERRRHNSSSMSDRSSRSRSPTKYNRSKSIGPKRRSCSRSPSFRNRSRSRSNSRGRFRGPTTNYIQHSPRRSMSPRYRQDELRTLNRYQDDSRHLNRRKLSPMFNNNRRPRSRGRSPLQYHRQDNRPDNRHENRSENRLDNSKLETRYDNRHQSRDHQRMPLGSHQNQQMRQDQGYDRYSRDRRPTSRPIEQHYETQINVLGDMVPGNEPPPPGYENVQSMNDKRGKLRTSGDEHISNRNQYQLNDKSDYIGRGYTPDPKVRRSEEKQKKREYENWDIEGRSENKRRKYSHSPSPLKQTKASGHQIISKNYNNQMKSRHREQPFEQNDRQVQRNEKDHIRHDREDRKHDKDGHNSSHSKDKKVSNDRIAKDSESYDKYDKEYIRNKPKDVEEKQHEIVIELEQKAKKVRDKKKKKKDKDDKEKDKDKEKKKLKKEKKEKEKKEREKDKNREVCPELNESEIKMNVQIENEQFDEIKIASINKTNKCELKNLITLASAEGEQIPKQEISEMSLHKEFSNNENPENSNNKFTIEEQQKYTNTSTGNNNEVGNSQELKMLDSVLDIHDFESNMEEFNSNMLKTASSLLSLPGVSKWEREDENSTIQQKKDSTSVGSDSPGDEKSEKITTDVLRRAENVIFTRAINAIRPIEIKKISADRQKLYSTDRNNLSPNYANQSLDDDLKAFQITVPVNNTNSSERSVEIRTEHSKREVTPTRSIKARLGQKISDTPSKRSKSRSTSASRVVAIDNGKISSQGQNREHYNYKDDKREIRLTVTNKPDNNHRSKDKERLNTRDIVVDRNRFRDDRKDSSRDERKGSSRDERKDSSRDERKDFSRDERKDTSRNERKDSTRDERKDSSRDERKDSSRDERKDSTRDERKDSSRDERKDFSRSNDRIREREKNRDRREETRKPRSLEGISKEYSDSRSDRQKLERPNESSRHSRFERSDRSENVRDKNSSPRHRSTSQSLRKHEPENKRPNLDDGNRRKRPRSPPIASDRIDKRPKQGTEQRQHNIELNQTENLLKSNKSVEITQIEIGKNSEKVASVDKSLEKLTDVEKSNENKPRNNNTSSSSSDSDTSSEIKKKRKHKSKKKRSKSKSQSSPKSKRHKSKKKSSKSSKKKKSKK